MATPLELLSRPPQEHGTTKSPPPGCTTSLPGRPSPILVGDSITQMSGRKMTMPRATWHTKICQLDPSVSIDEDILWLQVAVQN